MMRFYLSFCINFILVADYMTSPRAVQMAVDAYLCACHCDNRPTQLCSITSHMTHVLVEVRVTWRRGVVVHQRLANGFGQHLLLELLSRACTTACIQCQ